MKRIGLAFIGKTETKLKEKENEAKAAESGKEGGKKSRREINGNEITVNNQLRKEFLVKASTTVTIKNSSNTSPLIIYTVFPIKKHKYHHSHIYHTNI